MKTGIPSLAVMLGSLLLCGAVLAQGGDNPAPSGTASAKQESQSATTPKARKAGTQHASARHAKKHHMRQGSHASSSGTQAAGGVDRDTRAALARCTSMTDRSERAACAREAWESHHGAS